MSADFRVGRQDDLQIDRLSVSSVVLLYSERIPDSIFVFGEPLFRSLNLENLCKAVEGLEDALG